MDYYYTDPANNVCGPVSVEQLQSLASTGVIDASCMVVPVGSQQWVTIASVVPKLAQQTGEPISSYLVQSILVTLCCCMPLGIVAIVFAAQVDSKKNAGDVIGARRAARTAKILCLWGLGLGIASNCIGVVFTIIRGLLENH